MTITLSSKTFSKLDEKQQQALKDAANEIYNDGFLKGFQSAENILINILEQATKFDKETIERLGNTHPFQKELAEFKKKDLEEE